MREASTQSVLEAGDDANPLWLRAANHIRQQIADDALPPGRRLPAERDLCQRLGVSRVTLRKALAQLVADGVLSSSHGRGWFVGQPAARSEWPNTLESFTETARRKGLEPMSRVVTAEVIPADFDAAEVFGVVAGSELFHLVRVRYLDGVAIGVDDSTVPLALAQGVDRVDFTSASLLAALADRGVEPLLADSIIEARGCDPVSAPLLELDEGDPVLAMRQMLADGAGRTVLITSIIYRGDRYRLHTTFARSHGTGRA
jgi:GntR family transcriptional regulator